jgi:hypothetical protein
MTDPPGFAAEEPEFCVEEAAESLLLNACASTDEAGAAVGAPGLAL